MEQRIAFCKSKYSHQVDEYVRSLTGSSLRAVDSNAIELLAPIDEGRMTPSQRRGYQQDRLLADIDDLAESQKPVPSNADTVYGADWRQKVVEYKDKKQFVAAVRVASVTTALAGAVLFTTASVFLFVRLIICGVGRIIKGSEKNNTKEVQRQAPKPVPTQEQRLVSPVAVAANPKPTAKTLAPTAEEFRQQLFSQTENLREAVQQLKNLAGLMEQRFADHDKNLSVRLKSSENQAENFKCDDGLLTKLADNIRNAIEAQSKDLSQTVENSISSHVQAVKSETERSQEIVQTTHKESVRLHAEGLTNVCRQIDELTRAVSTSASQQYTATETIKNMEQLLKIQTANVKEEVEPLKAVTEKLDQTLEKIQNNKSPDEGQAARLYTDGLGAITRQIGELAKAVNTLMSHQSEAAENSQKTAQLLKNQTASVREEVEPLKAIMEKLGQTLEKMRSSKSSDDAQASRQCAEGLNSIRKQIDELATTVSASTARGSDTAQIAERFEHLLSLQTERLKKEAEPLKSSVDKLARTLEDTRTSNASDSAEVSRLCSDGFESLQEHINEMAKALKALPSQQFNTADISEQFQVLLDLQAENLRKETEPLKAITEKLDQTLEKVRNSKSYDGAEASPLYTQSLDTIREQMEELSTAISASASRQSADAQIIAQLEHLLNLQTESIKKEAEPLKAIAEALAQTLEQVRGSKSLEAASQQLTQDTKIVRQISEESLQKSDAIGRHVADLTEQVCAIREYAATQQFRLAKLQDGYDWNLIKNFCLRVIRCIDNLDDRIGEVSCRGGNAEHLLAAREELAFVLESNGIEPFGAKIDSDYRGQENRLQVLNDRDDTDDSNLVGRIAQVVRPGYQCRVNDEYTKIVRPAQVRLYGPACVSDTTVRGK